MIALDTNVLARFFARDDKNAYEIAETLIASESVSVSQSVMLETEWVLRTIYDFSRADILTAFESLIALPNVNVLDPETIDLAISWSRSGLDFADALHVAQSRSADAFVTFDADLIKKGSRCQNAIRLSSPRQLSR